MSTPAAIDVPTINGKPRDANPNFAIIGYPAYLTPPPAETTLDPVYTPNQFTPPTFLIQAENDKNYGRNAIVYYRALMDAHIQAELHYFATGGHGFGIHPTGTPEEHWTALATFWLHTTGIIPRETTRSDTNSNSGSGISQPCPVVEVQPPVAGRPPRPNPNPNNTDNPCP
jgi:acetyl esterase/lipase